jgi:dTDP-4-dehydrorhamnose reductase
VKILITGGKGQLGRALEVALTGQEVWAPGHEELDVTDAPAVDAAIGSFRPDVVVHAAAWTDTAGCERDPTRALTVNAEGAANVAAACARRGISVLYVSSNEVFDGEKREPYREHDRPNPINCYARSKLEGERMVQAAAERHWIVRTSWLYGPGRTSFPEKILDAARRRGRLQLVTDEISSPTWTLDLARAIARLIQHEEWGVYHLTNAGHCSRMEWAQAILELGGVDVPLEPTTQAAFGAPYRKPVFTALANTRAAALGITLRPWREALADHFRLPNAAKVPASRADSAKTAR